MKIPTYKVGQIFFFFFSFPKTGLDLKLFVPVEISDELFLLN